ncbi:MAG: magnesium transporter CorA family protein [Deltaproteobacteria bacterium]|nr:magnesium transporter CorA family protein [Deltaproteobacteria bacterium]
MSTERFFHVNSKGKLARHDTLEQALAAGKRGGYVWLDYVDPTRDELERLIEPFEVHPLSIEDCLDDEQVPKIDDFEHHTLILVNRYRYADRQLEIAEVALFLGGTFLITVNHDQPSAAAFYAKLDEQIALNGDDVKKGPEFLLHVILDYIVDRKYQAIERLQDDLDGAEESIIESSRSNQPGDLMSLRRSVVTLRKSLFHEREVLVKICRRDSPFIGEKSLYHFRDVYDHLAKCFETTEIQREMITSLMEMYLSLVNNEMALTANRTNRVVRRLTLITTIFMPLTLLAGIGGMSEWTMMTGPQNWRAAYALFLLGMAVIGACSYALLRWVERRAESEP